MKRYIAMPSPNGTNHEQLYIPQRAAAYDAKPNAAPLCANMGPEARMRVADAIANAIERHSVVKDEDPMDNDDQHWIEQVLEFCEGKLDDADMKELAGILHSALSPDDVMDEPPPFLGSLAQAEKSAQNRPERRTVAVAA